MKALATLLLSAISFGATAQTTITNGGFELWGNTVPAGDPHEEPTNWYSNQSGSSTASLGGQTCFKDATVVHSGTYSVRVQTISGPFSTVINGNVTTGVVNAPTLSKADGYIGTKNYSTATDVRRMSFTGRPDSLVGWYKYTPGGAGEQGKVRAILHTSDYFDPELPSTYHTNPTANKIGDVTFLTPTTAVTTWTRFSVPFTYTSASSPAYIMINVTSSALQTTTISGSKLWLDDIEAVYTSSGSCGVPSTLSLAGVTSTSVTLNWVQPAGSVGSQYIVSTSATPTGSGTNTTALTYSATGLTPSTAYYASVRDSCGVGNFSPWLTVPFTTSATTGITDIATGVDLSVFPNPVKEEVNISINGAARFPASVQLMDISGRLITTKVAETASTSISMAGLSSGIYLLRYTDAEHTQTIRINKQ